MLAQNLEISLLQEKIKDAKKCLVPSIDEINMVELTNMVDEI